jgi:hypothetical protein
VHIILSLSFSGLELASIEQVKLKYCERAALERAAHRSQPVSLMAGRRAEVSRWGEWSSTTRSHQADGLDPHA